MKNFILTVLLLVLFEAQAFASVLSDLATSMKPGQWAEVLNMGNWNNGLGVIQDPNSTCDYTISYTDKMVWDTVTKKLFFLGQSHCNTGFFRLAIYDTIANTWSVSVSTQAYFGAIGGPSHSYNNFAGVRNGKLFYKLYLEKRIHTYDIATDTWSSNEVPAIPAGNVNCCGQLDYFPDRDSLAYVDGDWGIFEYTFSNKTWTNTHGTTVGGEAPMGDYENVGRYNPVRKAVFFGGGVISGPGVCCKAYELSAGNVITKLADLPAGYNLANSGISTSGILTVDPTTGQYIAFLADQNTSIPAMFTLDASNSTNQWVKQSSTVHPPWFTNSTDGPIFGTAAATLTEYGVSAFLDFQTNTSKLWLYKHTAGTPPSSGDFATRCAQPGVVKCFRFDVQTDLGGTYGDNTGRFNNSGACDSDPKVKCPVIDNSLYASGGGSLKFTIPSQSGSGASGQWFGNFSYDLLTQFGANSEFYIQWQQYFSQDFVNTFYQPGAGWKLMIVGVGDQPNSGCSAQTTVPCSSSCTTNDVVVQNTNLRGFPQMYNSCTGSVSHGPYFPFEEGGDFGSGFDIKFQNARTSPYCLYSQGVTNPKTFFPPQGNCFPFVANEWMSFQVHVKNGPLVNGEYAPSHVDLWAARQGQPSEKIISYDVNLSAGPTGEPYGKIWLLPYHTNKDATQVHPEAYTWYDELIISRNKVADPSGITPPPPQNAAPVVNAGPDQTITLPAGATLNGTASDDGLPTNSLTTVWSLVTGPGTVTFANASAAKTTATFSASGAYVLNLKATDGSLTVSDDVLVLVNPPPVATNSIDLNTNTNPVVKMFRCNNDGCQRILQVKKSDKVTINGIPQK